MKQNGEKRKELEQLQQARELLHSLDEQKKVIVEKATLAYEYEKAVTSLKAVMALPDGKLLLTEGLLAAVVFAVGLVLLLAGSTGGSSSARRIAGFLVALAGGIGITVLIGTMKGKCRRLRKETEELLHSAALWQEQHKAAFDILPVELQNEKAADYILKALHASPQMTLAQAIDQCRKVPGMVTHTASPAAGSHTAAEKRG